MELNKYEFTVVLDVQLEQKKMDDLVAHIEKLIAGSQGKVVKIDHWGKRRLAYEIKRKQYGHYVHFLFESDGSNIAGLERDLTLNESVLRFLTVRLDKHALRSLKQESAEEEPAPVVEEEPVAEVVEEKPQEEASTETSE